MYHRCVLLTKGVSLWCSEARMAAEGVPNAHALEMAAASAAARLRLQLPPLNVPAHLQRAARALDLPEVWTLARLNIHVAHVSAGSSPMAASRGVGCCSIWV